MAALGRRGGKSGAVPRLNLGAVDPHAIEQQLQVVLRMRHCIAAAKRRLARAGCDPGMAQRIPGLGVEREIEIGEDHGAAGQFTDHAQQPGQCG